MALRTAIAAAALAGGAAAAHSATDVLNFALNLECLEAEFYSYAAFGKGLTEAQRGGGPAPIGGRKADLSPELQSVAEEIASDEIAHVEFLRAALGDAAVPCPLIDIGPAFEAAANAAAGTTLDPTFDPYANDLFFLHGAFIFEDVGVTAYRGALGELAELADPATVSAAGGILGTEAYHAGAVRAILLAKSLTETTPYGPIDVVVRLISDLRDSVDGADDKDQGIVGPEGMANIVPADDDALVYARDVASVLAIVYLGGEDMGGFFPEGVTGFYGPDGASMTMTQAPTGSYGTYGASK